MPIRKRLYAMVCVAFEVEVYVYQVMKRTCIMHSMLLPAVLLAFTSSSAPKSKPI